jgi:hypothetical protein
MTGVRGDYNDRWPVYLTKLPSCCNAQVVRTTSQRLRIIPHLRIIHSPEEDAVARCGVVGGQMTSILQAKLAATASPLALLGDYEKFGEGALQSSSAVRCG